jgi:hypothetical protein
MFLIRFVTITMVWFIECGCCMKTDTGEIQYLDSAVQRLCALTAADREFIEGITHQPSSKGIVD